MLPMTAEDPVESDPPPAADTHEVPNLLKFYDTSMG